MVLLACLLACSFVGSREDDGATREQTKPFLHVTIIFEQQFYIIYDILSHFRSTIWPVFTSSSANQPAKRSMSRKLLLEKRGEKKRRLFVCFSSSAIPMFYVWREYSEIK